jgi:hypothetical protein
VLREFARLLRPSSGVLGWRWGVCVCGGAWGLGNTATVLSTLNTFRIYTKIPSSKS